MNVYHASDYAGMGFKGGSFYYGYEVTRCLTCNKIGGSSCENEDHHDEGEEWCFQSEVNGKKLTIPHSQLNAKVEQWDVIENLLMGICMFMEITGVAE